MSINSEFDEEKLKKELKVRSEHTLESLALWGCAGIVAMVLFILISSIVILINYFFS